MLLSRKQIAASKQICATQQIDEQSVLATNSWEVLPCNTTIIMIKLSQCFEKQKYLKFPFIILDNEIWTLTEELEACINETDIDTDPIVFMTIDECSNKCKEKTIMFAYGTNDFEGAGCKDGLCKCHCVTSYNNDYDYYYYADGDHYYPYGEDYYYDYYNSTYDMLCTVIDHTEYWLSLIHI